MLYRPVRPLCLAVCDRGVSSVICWKALKHPLLRSVFSSLSLCPQSVCPGKFRLKTSGPPAQFFVLKLARPPAVQIVWAAGLCLSHGVFLCVGSHTRLHSSLFQTLCQQMASLRHCRGQMVQVVCTHSLFFSPLCSFCIYLIVLYTPMDSKVGSSSPLSWLCLYSCFNIFTIWIWSLCLIINDSWLVGEPLLFRCRQHVYVHGLITVCL